MGKKSYQRKILLNDMEVSWLIELNEFYYLLIGVLGLCAIVLSSPYDIPSYVPDALMLLCEHSYDPDLIQVCCLFFWIIFSLIFLLLKQSIKRALSEFRRTHHDSWHEHREKFTEDQLVILADVLISPNYYA